jgi:hypothetical protein
MTGNATDQEHADGEGQRRNDEVVNHQGAHEPTDPLFGIRTGGVVEQTPDAISNYEPPKRYAGPEDPRARTGAVHRTINSLTHLVCITPGRLRPMKRSG